MKKLLTIICAILFGISALHAQTSSRSVEATDIRMTHKNGQVEISFTLRAGKKVTKSSYNLVINPVVRGEAIQRPLPSIIIQGKRSKVADLRHELAAGEQSHRQAPIYMAPGTSLDYTATLPYEEWMRGSELMFDGVSVGCCSATEVELGLVADNILDGGPQIETKIVEIPTVAPPTTGEQMAQQYPFVAPASEFELLRQVLEQSPTTFDDGRSEMSQRVIAQIRDGSISIFFGQGLRVIDSNFGDNNSHLVELIAAVRALATAQDTKIAAIVIAGFASPEGSPELNDRLAWDRAVAVKEFLTRNTEVDPRTVRIYNGGVDWTACAN